ncbi:MAG: nucleotidyltransferase family protein [Arachnia sp.]
MVDERMLLTTEAVELVCAWTQRLAEAHGLRALIIKGATLHRQELRLPRSSSDVDLLVAPADFEALCDALVQAGWGERDTGFLMGSVPLHSRTFIAEGWPCDIDVHARFPGFLTDDHTVFEVLWERRVTMTFAGQPCAVPDRVCSALILALHSLRSTREQARHDAELNQMYRAVFTPSEQRDLVAVAARTGSAEALENVLPRIGLTVPESVADVDPVALRSWKERVGLRDHGLGTYDLIRALREAPLRRKPHMLWRAIWPSDHDLDTLRPGVPHDSKARNAARWDRLRKGVVAFPQVVRATLRHRTR